MKSFKKVLVLLVVLSMLLTLAACGGGKGKNYIGISMPTKSSERWIKDGETMKKILDEKAIPLTYSSPKMTSRHKNHKSKT